MNRWSRRIACIATAVACGAAPAASSPGSVNPFPNADIYSIRPDGSGRIRLTSSAEQEAFPAVSPDGRLVAFVRSGIDSGRRAVQTGYVISARGGAAQPLGPAEASAGNPFQRGPVWSRGGELAMTFFDESTCRGAVTKCATPEIRIGSLAGLRTLIRRAADPSWSPTGDRLVVEGEWTVGEPRALQIVTASTGAVRTLPVAGVNPSWSADGRFLAFDRDESTPGALGALVRIADLKGVTLRNLHAASEPLFAPRGSALAFRRARKLPGTGRTVQSLYVLTAPGGRPLLLGPGGSVAWSPDARRLIVSRTTARGTELALVGVDGKQRRRIITERTRVIGRPAWGANGRIYYALLRSSARPDQVRPR